ncbi:MAG: hypothetical protein HYU66_12195 [Armatimonadetes bacterium]|nr:hypothetical protein [Armatimonadota bacterium]
MLVTPHIVRPAGRQTDVANGLALLTFRPGSLTVLTVFSVDGQQNFMQWTVPLPASPTSPGDVDRDGDADLLDFALIQQAIHIPQTPPEQGDLNSDGVVNLQDITIFTQSFSGPSGP